MIEPRGERSQSGFTLLEMLVALVVFAILMVGLTDGVHFGLAAWTRQSQAIAAADDLAAADRALRRLLEQLDPGTPSAPPLAIGAPDRFEFTSDLPLAAALPTRRADMLLLVDARHRLVLRWTPHLRHPPMAPPIGPGAMRETELLAGVDHVVFSYWPPPPATGWQSAWKAPVLPALIRIRLELSGRHWPDIVAAPASTQPPPAPAGSSQAG